MRYDIYRRDNLMLVFETGKQPTEMNLTSWKRLHIGVNGDVLANGTKPISQIDREISQNGMTTVPVKHVARQT
ncbi:hypothetical protein [Dongia rigui]|uniref:Uncharacterized protein n=1 Tax=Dongia rigui TaxID=940149 RepID=A0ABU5E0E4_9PROT|nr:hypothetical protein [Dongia rigui]MDY0873059.1 hypothetical protein [Dongia rigui]